MELSFQEMLTSELLESLHDDQIDVGIIATNTGQSFFEEDLFLEPFLGYVSAKHKFSSMDKLDLSDLYEENLWLLNEGHCFRDQAIKLCKKDNEKISKGNISFESGNLETLKRLVEQDFGVTLMPYLSMEDHDTRCAMGVIKEFNAPIPTRKIRLVYSREFLKKNFIGALTEVIKNSIPEVLKTQKEELVV